MEKFDVAVVGAGPAGSTAARFAALGGARTVCLERRSVVGSPVQCGEFLPDAFELRRMFPEDTETVELLQPADDFVRARTRLLRMFSPSCHGYDVPFDGCVVDRDRFEQSLAAKAAGAGAEVRTAARVIALQGGVLETSSGQVHARVVIGADGPKSVVARSIGLREDARMAFGVQYVCSGGAFDPSVVEMHFGPVARGGYAWVIPKGESVANVGLGGRTGSGRPAMMGDLDSFVKVLEERNGRRLERGRFTAGLIPVGGPRRRTVLGNVLLAGDAAGHLMAANGGGIPTAMICGRIAGEVAAEHLGKGAPLSEYESRWRAAIGRELSQAVSTRRLFDAVSCSQLTTEAAMSIAGPRGMRDIIMCRPWHRAALYA
ncbi:MAG: geranylgeranyl reductase family protein [Planctomycetota bacterium]|jgi:digeranylgeranylglycerophospholipid reductase